jgi:hypothetical protein
LIWLKRTHRMPHEWSSVLVGIRRDMYAHVQRGKKAGKEPRRVTRMQSTPVKAIQQRQRCRSRVLRLIERLVSL